jgi:hypothetical protein
MRASTAAKIGGRRSAYRTVSIERVQQILGLLDRSLILGQTPSRMSLPWTADNKRDSDLDQHPPSQPGIQPLLRSFAVTNDFFARLFTIL